MSDTYSIHKRIYNFVVEVIVFIKKVPRSPENNIVVNQLTRSATSMGANDREADGTITKNDFIHKYSIVRKEGKETEYWLQLLKDTNSYTNPEIDALLQENAEIIKIVSAIIYNTGKKNK